MKIQYLNSLLAITIVTLMLSVISLISYQQVQAEPKPQTGETETKETTEPVQLLFVQNSLSGSYDGKRLTLNGIGSTIFFSDRPERVAGQVKTAEFISHWHQGSDNFAENPPNATLSIFNENGVDSIVVELTDPQLENNNLSYQVKVLQGKLPATFKESSLFIDILGRWRMYSYGYAAGAASAGAANYYYHPVAPVVPVTPAVVAPVAPVYVAPRPVVVY